MQTVRKYFYIVSIFLGLLLIIFALGLVRARRYRPEAFVSAVDFHPPSPARLGDVLQCRMIIEMPWYKFPVAPPRIELPEGMRQLDTGTARITRPGLGIWRWTVTVPVQPYAIDTYENIVMSTRIVTIFPREKRELSVELPELAIAARPDIDNAAPLAIAPGIADDPHGQGRTWLYRIGFFILLVTIIFVLIAISLRKEEIAGPDYLLPEEIAIRNLSGLKKNIPGPADKFFLRLTDIIREYIEIRLRLRATEQTTPEFLKNLAGNHQVKEEDRRMLADLLTAADMAKFARRPATREEMYTALAKAENLIYSIKDRSD